MLALLTSCNRPDLLKITLDSLLKGMPYSLDIIVHEDGSTVNPVEMNSDLLVVHQVHTGGVGQHKSIERFLQQPHRQRYYLHLEDDWQINNSYDWISRSIAIMEQNSSIIKVLAREGSPHPCVHDQTHISTLDGPMQYGFLEPWENNGIRWHGFSWNCGVTRFDLLRKFVPFPKYEQELAQLIYMAGYKIVELARPVYKHIGEGRSTHE